MLPTSPTGHLCHDIGDALDLEKEEAKRHSDYGLGFSRNVKY